VAITFTKEDRDAGVPRRELATALRDGAAPDVRWHVRRDGSLVFIEGATRRITDPAGRPSGVLKIGQDVTARWQIEAALRESEERFRAIADLVPDLLWRADAAGNRTWGNRRWMEYTNQTIEEAVGMGWSETIHPDDRPGALERYRKSIETGRPFRHEHRLRGPDGNYRWFVVEAVAVRDADEEISQWFGACTDIHEQRMLMDALEERVEKRTRQVRRLAAKLSVAEQEERRRIAYLLHDDLQQQLFGAALTLSLVPGAATADEREELVRQVGRTLEHATKLSQSLATELSPAVLHSERLGEVLRWLAIRQRELLGLQVEVQGEADADDAALRTLIYHLVREALFNVARHAGTDHARILLQRTDDHVEVRIEDEGRGFEPSEIPGSGFGLASIRERLELVGGRLNIDAEPGRGTRISLILPTDASRDML
jgi:two-component system, chemotaxis family, CheB/CheR fusion protein